MASKEVQVQISVTLPEHLGESGDEEQILAYVQDHLDTDRWTAKAKKALFGNAMMLCSTYGCDPKPPGQPGNTSYNENHLTADQFISVKEDLVLESGGGGYIFYITPPPIFTARDP